MSAPQAHTEASFPFSPKPSSDTVEKCLLSNASALVNLNSSSRYVLNLGSFPKRISENFSLSLAADSFQIISAGASMVSISSTPSTEAPSSWQVLNSPVEISTHARPQLFFPEYMHAR